MLNKRLPCQQRNLCVSTTPTGQTDDIHSDQHPHLLDHSFHLPLLAENHVVQVFDPLPEVHGLRLQLFGPGLENIEGYKPTATVEVRQQAGSTEIRAARVCFGSYIDKGLRHNDRLVQPI